MTAVFVCPNCGATHGADTPGGCFLEMLVAVVRDRGTVDETSLLSAAATIDAEDLWEDFMAPAAEVLEGQRRRWPRNPAGVDGVCRPPPGPQPQPRLWCRGRRSRC